jgi:hypothetical protein
MALNENYWNTLASYGPGSTSLLQPPGTELSVVPYSMDPSLGSVGTAVAPVAGAIDPNQFSSLQKWMGGTNAAGAQTMGYIPTALGIGNIGLNAFMGMKQYGLAKDQFNLQKEAFNKNYALQKKTLNNTMANRARANAAANPNAMSEAEYMSKYGLK